MQVEVISLKRSKADASREIFNNVSVLRLPMTHWRGTKLTYFFQYGIFLLASFLLLAFRSAMRPYALVHVHNMPDILVFAALVPKICGARVILDLHDPMPELMMTIFGLAGDSFGVRLLKRLERLSVAFADLVLTPNAAFHRLFVSRGCSPEKLHVVMNTPDENIFQIKPAALEVAGPRLRTKPFVVMYHGALVERHGLDLAIQAIESLRSSIPGAELRIYGRQTPFVQRMMEQVHDQELDEAVKYCGGRTLEEIVKAIDDCDVGIIPNRRGLFTELNLPTRIFEYLARGKAVIAPRTPGIQDYFREEELVFFELGNGKDLAQKLRWVFEQPCLAARIARDGQGIYCAHRWTEERRRFLTIVAAALDHASGRQNKRPTACYRAQAAPGTSKD
jgi:glycosyltransferase involved in cell wall biosynthesis